MTNTFSILSDTTPVNEFEFSGDQAQKAAANGAKRVFRFRDIRGNVNALPKYIKEAIKAAGYTPIVLGGTTYKYSVIGLV